MVHDQDHLSVLWRQHMMKSIGSAAALLPGSSLQAKPMMTLLGVGVALMALTACGDDEPPRPTVPTLEFTAPADGAQLTAADDANATIEGIQPAFRLDIADLSQGVLSMTATPAGAAAPSATTEISLSGSGPVTVSTLTLEPGTSAVTAELRSNNGVLLADTTINLSLEVIAVPPTVRITSPRDGESLNPEDDTDDTIDGLQFDVEIELGPEIGDYTTALAINGTVADSLDVINNNRATFTGITLPEGEVALTVTVANEDGQATTTHNITVLGEPNQCSVSLAAPNTDGNCDFGTFSDEDEDTDGVQVTFTVVSDCLNGSARVNGEDYDFEISNSQGEFTATLQDGINVVSVEVNTEGFIPGEAEETFTADFQTPAVTFFFPEDGATLNPEEDTDDNLDNGITFTVSALIDDVEPGEEVVTTLVIDDGDPIVADGGDERRALFSNISLSAGAHTLEVFTTDECGNVSSEAIAINVTDQVRSLTVESPAPGTAFGPNEDLDTDIDELQQTFTVRASGLETDDAVFIECRRTNSEAFFRRSEDVAFGQQNPFEISVTLPDGAFNCRARSGDLTSETVLLSASLSREAITLTRPSEGELLNTPVITVAARTTNIEEGERVALGVGEARYESTVIDGGVVFDGVQISPGDNVLNVQAITLQAPEDSVTITLDVEPPTLSFTDPSEGDPSVTDQDDLVGGLDNGIQINVQLEALGVEPGAEVCVTADQRSKVCGNTDDDGAVTVGPLMVTPGQNVLRATTTDAANNEGEASLTIDVQIDRPRINITSPVDGSAISQAVAVVEVETDLTEGTEVRLFVNGADNPTATTNADVDGAAIFTGVALLIDQENTLQARGADARGEGVSPFSRVLVSTTAPEITITSPNDGDVFNSDVIDGDGAPGFQIRVEVDTPGLIDGQPATITADCGDDNVETFDATVSGEQAIFERVTLTDPAVCTLTATATNQANLSGEDTINVIIDRQAPVLTPVRLNDGDILNINDDEDLDTPGIQSTLRVRFEGIEPGQTISLRGGPLQDDVVVGEDETQVAFGPVTLPDGELELTFSATDLAGNSTSVRLELLVDASIFVLNFEDITNPAMLNANTDEDPNTEGLQTTLTVVGVRGLTGNTVLLCSDAAPEDAAPCATGGFGQIGEATLTTELASAQFPLTLPEGIQRLIAETDAEGDLLATEVLELTVDNIRPEITAFTIVSDTEEPFGLLGRPEDEQPLISGSLTARFRVEGQGIAVGDQVRLFEGGAVLTSGEIREGGFVELTRNFIEGAHTVSADVTDGAGNNVAARPEVTFSVDVTAPLLSFDNLSQGQTLRIADDVDTDIQGMQYNVVASSDAIGRTARLVRIVGGLDLFDTPDDDIIIAEGIVDDNEVVAFNNPVTLAEGVQSLALRIGDEAGNVTDRTVDLSVDSIAPIVTIQSPANNAVFAEEPEAFRLRPGFQIEVLINSDSPGREVELFDAVTELPLATSTTLDDQGNATLVATLQSGANALQARVSDAQGNLGTSSTIDVNVELTGCGIIFATPDTNPLFIAEDNDDDPANGVQLSFETVIADVQTCLGQNVQLFVNDTEVAASALTESGSVSFTDVAFANNDTYNVIAQIDDGQGNVSVTSVVTIFVDLITPTVSFNTPANDATFARADDAAPGLEGLQTQLVIDTTDAIGGTLTVTSDLAQAPVAEDVAITADQITLDNVTLPEGAQTLTVTVTDRAQSTAEATVAITADLTAPADIALSGVIENPRLGTTTLTWAAPGDDGDQGNVTRYEVRASNAEINAGNFAAAQLLQGFDAQGAPGAEETFDIAELAWQPTLGTPSVTWFLAVRAFDDQNNSSTVSDNFEVTLGLNERNYLDPRAGGQFAYEVNSIGDVNNDGFDDFVVCDLPANFSGESGYLIYGGEDIENFDENSVVPLSGDEGDGFGFFGARAAALGDINGDNIDDFALTSYFANVFAGKVYVFLGTDGGQTDGEADVRINGTAAFGQAGVAIAGGNFFDVAQEGLNDIIIGASAESAVYVIAGREVWPATLDLIADEPENATNDIVRLVGVPADEFGYQVEALSDLDDDGLQEIAVGDRRFDNGVGRINIFSSVGVSSGDTLTVGVDDTVIDAFTSAGLFAASMATGDFDNDGVIDLVVGAYDTPDAISVYLFGEGIPTEPSEQWSLPRGGLYGERLATGDINGDGFDDIIVGGAPPDSGAGTLDVYFSEEGTFGGTPDLRYERNNAWARDVATGDFNNDGYDDILTNQTAGDGASIFLY